MLAILLQMSGAWAQLTVQGAGGEARPYLIAVPQIANDENTQSGKLQELLIEDFKLSGLFDPVFVGETINPSVPPLQAFQGRAEFLIYGRIEPSNASDANLRAFQRTAIIRIFDLTRQAEIEGLRIVYDIRQIAIATHQMADAIVERLTGVRVGFSQLLAMVVKNGKQYDIVVSDILGKNSHSIVHSVNPIISLSWSPNGQQIAYASFENGPSRVYLQNINSGERQMIQAPFDSSSSPAWSNDGKKIAFAGYLNQKTAIYEYDLSTQAITPLVDEGAINTEPVYGFDGYLYFSSGRSSMPQIYRLRLSDRKTERVSVDQKNCLRPSVAKNQPLLAYLNRDGEGVSLLNLQTNQLREIAIPNRADGVAISPNGRLIAVSIAQGRRFQTIITNVRGSYSKLVGLPAQQYYEPSWRPQ